MNNREAHFRPQLLGGAPATVADSTAPVYLIVIAAESDAADLLALAAPQARGVGARLLVALIRPRLGFTTDPALVRFVTARRKQEVLRLERLGHQVLDPAGVTFETVSMTYRGGGSESGQTRRIAAALERLARGRGAIRWPATGAVAASRNKGNHQ
ncbi:hypothetical protein [Arthrobacter sp. Br18]|uniref:hypothetical protein n=1 Tax=Arthrobacter sp. Br18 TaxID=1312954 RepID=UPI0012DFDBB0|nr:hypothetical protein [Arthrobacter sp. Br18]